MNLLRQHLAVLRLQTELELENQKKAIRTGICPLGEQIIVEDIVHNEYFIDQIRRAESLLDEYAKRSRYSRVYFTSNHINGK